MRRSGGCRVNSVETDADRRFKARFGDAAPPVSFHLKRRERSILKDHPPHKKTPGLHRGLR